MKVLLDSFINVDHNVLQFYVIVKSAHDPLWVRVSASKVSRDWP